MFRKKSNEAGFIPLMLTVLACVVAVIVVIYLRIAHVQAK
jgi:hypothetical protein